MELMLVSNILLWCAVLLLAAVVFALTRQVGVLHERVAPAGALAVNRNLAVGRDAPVLSVQDIDGKTHEVGGADPAGRSTLIFWIAPDCPVCKSLLPVLKSAARAEADWMELLLASDGPELDHRAYIAEYGLGDWPYVVSELLGRTYGVAKLPYAVVVDEAGRIASLGIINSREHLESLFEAKERKVASIQDYMNRQQGDSAGTRSPR